MLIDWFTVGAQVVNFLILVWLLKRFLYKPILNAIDARESGIADRLAEAEKKQKEAQTEQADFQLKSEAIEQQRGALLSKAMTDADTERERLLAEARTAADAVRLQWQDALRNEQQGLKDEIVRRTQQGVFNIARKTLAELGTANLEECIANVFIIRLRALSSPQQEQFASSLKTTPQPVLIRSAFDMPAAQRSAIEGAVRKTFAIQSQFRYETAPGLVSGIELTTNGQKIAWSIADSLAALQKDVNALVEEKTKPEATPADGTKLDAPAEPEHEVKAMPGRQLVAQ